MPTLAENAPLSPMTARRRWSFGLRTLLLAVTIIAGPLAWVGYSLNWIHERHAFVVSQNIFFFEPSEPARGWDADPPWRLGIFGEPGCYRVVTNGSLTKRQVAEIKRLFPEAKIDICGVVREDEPTPSE